MSEKNEDIRNLLEEIRAKGNNAYDEEEEEPSRKWSHEDIDRLLEITDHKTTTVEKPVAEKHTENSAEATMKNKKRVKSEAVRKDSAVIVDKRDKIDNSAKQVTAVATEIKEDKTAVDISKPSEKSVDNSRLKALMEDGPEKKKSLDLGTVKTANKTANKKNANKDSKNKFSGLLSGIKQQTKKIAEGLISIKEEDDEEDEFEDENSFLRSNDNDFDDEYDTDLDESDEEEIEETDNLKNNVIENKKESSGDTRAIPTYEIADKNKSVKPEYKVESDDEEAEEKTRVMPKANVKPHNTDEQEKTRKMVLEKLGTLMQNGEKNADSGVESAPAPFSDYEALKKFVLAYARMEKGNSEVNRDDLKRKIAEAEMEGQIVLNGFEKVVESPEQVDESEAEQKLFEKRRDKIRKFTLFGEDDEGEFYSEEEESEKLGELFEATDEKPKHKEHIESTFSDIEYSQQKDSRRVLRYLGSQKKKSSNKILILGVLTLISFIVGIASAIQSSIGGDRILTIFSNFVIIALALAVSNQTLVSSFELLKKKKVNINTGISIAAIVSFIQNLLMFILYFVDANTVSVFSGTGVALLFIGELNNYVTFKRTLDATKLCTGDNKDKLYSIEGITDDKDAVELGKNVKSSSPRIRYSCKTKFPSHLIELCMSQTAADKMMIFVLPVIGFLAIINCVCAWLIKSDLATGFAAFTITLTMCVPAYGALLIQLPLRWTNKILNSSGGLISCQESVNELCRTNAVIIDSSELFDQSLCAMRGLRDFKNVRVDDAMLYAAAMIIRSGGPLTGVFDQVVAKRRDVLPAVKSFSYEEKLGVSGWIYGQKVILGNRSLMENHNIVIPEGVDEGKYHFEGHEVMFLAIAHKLAALFVLDYVPNKNITEMLKKLRDSSVTILVRNCDPNVTEKMLSDCYGIKLDNIKIINSSAGRVFNKYKSRPKLSTRAMSINNGSVDAFMKSLCLSATLKHVFKFSNMLMFVGIFLSFAIILTLSLLNVIADLPAVFTILLQLMAAGIFASVTRLLCSK